MALTAAQIVALACQEARCTGFIVQAGQLLNQILADLCQEYDFDVARRQFLFTFNSATGIGSGPYQLPADYLRAENDGFRYIIDGVPYTPIPIDLTEFDRLVLTSGISGFPTSYATDLSGTGSPWSTGFSPGFGPSNPAPRMYVWPPANGSYQAYLRYFAKMNDIVTPESSGVVPWFPNQTYLRRRLAGELMGLTDDERMAQYLGSSEDQTPNGAGVELRRYLKMKDDQNTRAQTVQLDRRRFGSAWDRLRNTKQVGW